MSTLLSMGSCPFCGSGTRTSCFATYDDGYCCFTCGKKKIEKAGYAWKPAFAQKPSGMMELPQMTQNISKFSLPVLQWLYKYYVFDELIKKYSISYVPPIDKMSESLLLPVFDGQKLVSYQQRFFPKKSFITKGDKTQPYMIKCANPISNEIILVEDFISAIRLGEHMNTICLFGVHISHVMSKFIENLNMNIKIWLDPDAPGRQASSEMSAKLTKSMIYCAKYRAFAVREPRTVEVIMTALQPKDYSDGELIAILKSEIKNGDSL